MRTFVAFTLPDEATTQIVAWQQQNLPEGCYPEPPTNLHMTLAFFGDTPEELVPQINAILQQLDSTSVQISGPVAYEEQAKLAFLTYQETGGSEVWEQLNVALKDLMGYEPQFRPWLPHTTVWRFAPDHKPNISPELPQISFSPIAVTLYQSVRNEGGGATYQKVAMPDDYPEGMEIILDVSLGERNPVVVAKIPSDGARGYQTIGRLEVGPFDFPYQQRFRKTLKPGEPLEIKDVFVDPSYRRRGIALALLNKLIESGYNVQHSEDIGDRGRAWRDAIDMPDKQLFPNAAVESNILDPIQDELDQRVFKDLTPRPSVVQFVKRVYYRAFAKHFHVPVTQVSHYVNLCLTGSLTTYQYADTSDFDISVFPNYDAFSRLGLDANQARKELIRMSINEVDGAFVPGSPHPLQFFCQNPGVKQTDVFQAGLRSGYDLDKGQWVVPPERERSHDVKLEFPDVFARASEMADKMKVMLDDGDTDTAIELWKLVHEKRMLDQQAGLGDYCEGNIVYKWFVHEGIVDRLRHELGLQISTSVKNTAKDFDWNDFETVRDYRVPFYLMPDGTYEVGLPGDEHWEIPERRWLMQNKNVNSNGEGELQGHVVFHPTEGEKVFWPVDFKNLEEHSWITPEMKEKVLQNARAVWNHYGLKQSAAEDWGPMKIDQLKEPYNFQMPLNVEQQFVDMMTCPMCDHHLRNINGQIYCEYCGWTPRIALAIPPAIIQQAPTQQMTPGGVSLPTMQQGQFQFTYSGSQWIDDANLSLQTQQVQGHVAVYLGAANEGGWIQGGIEQEDNNPPHIYIETGTGKAQTSFQDLGLYTGQPVHVSCSDLNGVYYLSVNGHEAQATLGAGGQIRALAEDWHAPGKPNSFSFKITPVSHGRMSVYIDPEDEYFHDMEGNPAREHEYWRSFWIDPQDMFQKGNEWFVYALINSSQVDIGDLVEVKWETPQGRQKMDGQVIYMPDDDMIDKAYAEGKPPSEWAGIIKANPDTMQPIVYAKVAGTMQILYDFEKDRITLGSKEADVHAKLIGNYDAEDHIATLFEAEKQWVNPTYFRRLWNYSFPAYPLKSVQFKAGETTHKLRTRDHAYHERQWNRDVG